MVFMYWYVKLIVWSCFFWCMWGWFVCFVVFGWWWILGNVGGWWDVMVLCGDWDRCDWRVGGGLGVGVWNKE